MPAQERFLTPDAPDAEIERRARQEIEGISKSVDEHPGVQRLAANPLMLTILALIHRRGARLPSRRVELYSLAAKTLLKDWQLARGITDSNIVRETEALRLLGPLAHWMHENRPTGIASERDVKEELAKLLAAQRRVEPDDAGVEDAVDDFLRRAREHTGILVERARHRYGFMHLTFEEYFAARELVRRRRDAAARIYQHRHHPRWVEPIMLAIGFESTDHPDDAGDLIRAAILAEGEEAEEHGFEPSLYEDILRRDLLFAARCIGDCLTVEASLRRQVTGKLVELYFDFEGAGKYGPLRNSIMSTFAYLRGSEAGEDTARLLVTALKDESVSVRAGAARALGSLGQVSDEVIASLIAALNNKDFIANFISVYGAKKTVGAMPLS